MTPGNGTPTTDTATASDGQRVSGEVLCSIISRVRFSNWYNSDTGTYHEKKIGDEDVVEETTRRLRYDGYALEPAGRIIGALRHVEAVRARQARDRALAAFVEAVGQRYRDCTLENFQITSPAQRKVVDAIWDYGDHVSERVAAGTNVVLFGPSGSGKDHMLCGLARTAIAAGVSVAWRNGRDLFGHFRDAMDDQKESEGDILEALWKPDVLAISDPLPPSGPLSPYQQDTLYRVVDLRYRACRPLWMTLNVKDGQEADDRIGVPIVDRLRDGALALSCNWASHRKPWGQE